MLSSPFSLFTPTITTSASSSNGSSSSRVSLQTNHNSLANANGHSPYDIKSSINTRTEYIFCGNSDGEDEEADVDEQQQQQQHIKSIKLRESGQFGPAELHAASQFKKLLDVIRDPFYISSAESRERRAFRHMMSQQK